MIGLQKAYSPVAVLYSLLIVFFCEYVLLNMTLAILKYKYSQVKGNTIEEEEEEKTDYEPEFLKRLGIFSQVSRMPSHSPLARCSLPDKVFVGARHFFKDTPNKPEKPFNFLNLKNET